jgi:hypothetical protein
MSELVEHGIAALIAGRKAEAHDLLMEAVTLDPRDMTAWLWLADATDEDDIRADCLRCVLDIEPNHAPPAARRAASLVPVAAASAQSYARRARAKLSASATSVMAWAGSAVKRRCPSAAWGSPRKHGKSARAVTRPALWIAQAVGRTAATGAASAMAAARCFASTARRRDSRLS